MPVALTSSEYMVLVMSLVPVFVAAGIVWVLWRWAKRDEARELAELDAAARADRL